METPDLMDLLGPAGVCERIVPGWEARASQIRMAQAIQERLEDGGVAAIEAPTGVGKTLAYLLPAALSGRRVIVSTHTKTLQDQIVDKDLPRLARVLEAIGMRLEAARADEITAAPRTVRYALMKGRSNYLCLDRLERKTRQGTFGFDDDDLLFELRAWSAETETGDRSELVGLPERSPQWDEVDARSEICKGQRCEHYDSCFVVRMRRRAQQADLIVVNHHLLLADLALQAAQMLAHDGRAFGEILPAADALVLDEAHSLEEIATEYFGGSVSTAKLERLVTDVTGLAARMEGTVSGRITTAVARAGQAASAVFAALPREEGRTRARPGDPVPFAAARDHEPTAHAALDALAALLDERATLDPAAEHLARRVRDLADSLGFVLNAEDPDYVYWSERRRRSAILGASPIDVASLLDRFLFQRFESVAMTSATLSAGDDACRFFRSAVGAPEDTETLVLDSPFDFARQAALYLPHEAPEANRPGASRVVARMGGELIDLVGGGALFLFTSYRAMREVYQALAGQLRYPVFMQGERAKRELIASFIAQAPAVLFATASFWEGVDIPGEPLRLVLIDRLPFDPPNDPLSAARGERLDAEGRSGFAHYFVPRAILRLKQGFGRLVRSQSDRGVVAILDRRIRTKSYGRRFLAALPPSRRIARLDELRGWWMDDEEVHIAEPS